MFKLSSTCDQMRAVPKFKLYDVRTGFDIVGGEGGAAAAVGVHTYDFYVMLFLKYYTIIYNI